MSDPSLVLGTCPPPEVAVIIPTFNEAENVAEIARRLQACLQGIAWEIIFVDDDSPDGTAALVQELARRDPLIRPLRRLGPSFRNVYEVAIGWGVC